MRRGFKSNSERLAEDARTALGLGSEDRLDPWDYAASLDVVIVEPGDLDLPAHHANQLLLVDPGSWSGLTLSYRGKTLIVLNSAHQQARRCSTLMHELAHLKLGHVPANVQISDTGLLLLSDYSDEQEDEADWLMGALLLPRCALMRHRGRGLPLEKIAELYGVSVDLCQWRSRMTGVEAQLRARR